jgi:hypothetical protein
MTGDGSKESHKNLGLIIVCRGKTIQFLMPLIAKNREKCVRTAALEDFDGTDDVNIVKLK